MQEKKRWNYYFENYSNAYMLLKEAVNHAQPSQLEKEGTIQRFEICMELAWKCMKTYLEEEGVIFRQITPRTVLKEAIAARLIKRGDAWMEALDARNRMSHTYSIRAFERVLDDLNAKYMHCFNELYEALAAINNNES